jgi:Skp family chaperone for outer membrane proteins
MRTVLFAAIAFVALWPGVAASQEFDVSIPPPILTIDQDRLFLETEPGLEITGVLEERAAALTLENEAIEAQLIEEELSLTEQRATLPAEEFQALADAFDTKVQRIRAEQDQKAREINEAGEVARQQFFNDVAAVISVIVSERGALIVLDRREVFLSADRIDITDEAIARVNESVDR